MTLKQIGAAVRKARGQRSISEVAEAAGLQRHQVTGIEQATKAYTMPSLLALCKVVGPAAVFTGQRLRGCIYQGRNWL
jgi:transcriptional regulator with XRE-family HTH domain